MIFRKITGKNYQNCSVLNCVRQLCTLKRTHTKEQFLKTSVDLRTGFVRLLWPPYVIGGHNIFALWLLSFFLSIFFYSSPNLSGWRLDVYHTSTHGVALVRI